MSFYEDDKGHGSVSEYLDGLILLFFLLVTEECRIRKDKLVSKQSVK